MKMATINVRIPEDMKRAGDMVLARNDVSISEVIRKLYHVLDSEQEIPPWLEDSCEAEENVYAKRRRLVRNIAGIAPLPAGYDLGEIKNERLSWLIEESGHNEAVL